ncbi:MAG: hypothetical protein J6R38_00560, partial [Alistipes sp.]|nr:hypothetical protein [Alistipes sp.]
MKSLTPPIGVQIYTQFLNLQNFLAKFSIYPPPTTAIGLSVQALRIGGFFVSVPHLTPSDKKLGIFRDKQSSATSQSLARMECTSSTIHPSQFLYR